VVQPGLGCLGVCTFGGWSAQPSAFFGQGFYFAENASYVNAVYAHKATDSATVATTPVKAVVAPQAGAAAGKPSVSTVAKPPTLATAASKPTPVKSAAASAGSASKAATSTATATAPKPVAPVIKSPPVDASGLPVELLVVSVLCGRMLPMGLRIDKSLERKSGVFDKGYDSTVGGPHPVVPKGGTATGGESRIHAVYRSSQIYPEYVLTYQRKTP
jgi:hypothetical protein